MDDFRVQPSYPRKDLRTIHSKHLAKIRKAKKQDVADKVLTDYVERIGGARGLEK